MDALSSLSSSSSVQATLSSRIGNMPLKSAKTGQDIDKISKDFESMFMSQMLQPMMETVEVDSDFGGGHGEEMMRGFMVQEFGRSLAENGNTGLSVAIKNRMLQSMSATKESSLGSQFEVKA